MDVGKAICRVFPSHRPWKGFQGWSVCGKQAEQISYTRTSVKSTVLQAPLNAIIVITVAFYISYLVVLGPKQHA